MLKLVFSMAVSGQITHDLHQITHDLRTPIYTLHVKLIKLANLASILPVKLGGSFTSFISLIRI